MACLSTLHEKRSELSCLMHSPLCEFLISGHDDGTIRLWNADSGSTITLNGHTNTVCCLDVTTRGAMELLLSAGFDGHVGVWDITKRQVGGSHLESTPATNASAPHAPSWQHHCASRLRLTHLPSDPPRRSTRCRGSSCSSARTRAKCSRSR
jgi:WD40 repeat protein